MQGSASAKPKFREKKHFQNLDTAMNGAVKVTEIDGNHHRAPLAVCWKAAS